MVAFQKELEEQSPVLKYTEAKTALMKWINDVEGMLLSEHVILTHPQVMEQQLVKFQVCILVTHLYNILKDLKFNEISD